MTPRRSPSTVSRTMTSVPRADDLRPVPLEIAEHELDTLGPAAARAPGSVPASRPALGIEKQEPLVPPHLRRTPRAHFQVREHPGERPATEQLAEEDDQT